MQIRVRSAGSALAERDVVQHELDTLRGARLETIQTGDVLGAASAVEEHIAGHLNVALALAKDTRTERRHRILATPTRPCLAALFRVDKLVVQCELSGEQGGASVRVEFQFLQIPEGRSERKFRNEIE